MLTKRNVGPGIHANHFGARCYTATGLDCVLTTCSPSSHAATNCDSGHLYWYDSCGAREDMAENCGSRGCTSASCGAITWKDRSLALTGSLYVTDIALTSSGELIAIGTDSASITVRRWNGSWGEFAPGASTFTPPKLAYNPTLGLDFSNNPFVVYTTTFERTGYFPTHEVFLQRWSGTWSGMGDSATYDANSGGISRDFHIESETPRITVNEGGSPVVAWTHDSNDIAIGGWDGVGWTRSYNQAYKTSSSAICRSQSSNRVAR